MAMEILGHEFSPHGVVEHVCVFGALGFVVATSAYGTWVLASKFASRQGWGRRV
jgi:hypothetical protein